MATVNKSLRDTTNPHGTGEVVARNIRALLLRRERDERQKGHQDRVADAITRITGSLKFVYIQLGIFAAWIVINVGWTPLPVFDPSLVLLAMVASVEAIFLSTFVLISQNQMQTLADKRADLDLQISLLAEHEVTLLLRLVTDMAKRMGIEGSHDPELSEFAQAVAPEKVLDKMEQAERELRSDDGQR